MSEYIKHTWVDDEVIDAPKLNNIETGIVEAKKAAEGHTLALDNHNKSSESHADIRKILQDLAAQINTLLNADESTLAEMQEMIDYINSNKDLIDEIATGKVNVTDIVDNLVTNVANKPLSAAQGVVLKSLIDTLQTSIDKAATTAQNNLSSHNTNTEAHADLRLELQALTNRINAALDSDDTTLDELSEIVAYIKSNKSLIDAITTSKVNVSDIVDDLVTNVKNRPLSAAQGVVLKSLIDTLQTAVNGKAPTSHASTGTTYGAGSGSNYGHVKLSDSTSGTSNENGGVAATPAAVKAAYDLAAKKPTPSEIGAAKIYVNVASLGLSPSTVTPLDIFNNMEDNSIGLFAVGTDWNADAVPTQYGTLFVARRTTSRAFFLFEGIGGTYQTWMGTLNTTDGVSFSGWRMLYDTTNKPTLADVGAAAATHTHGAAQITSGVFSATNIKAKTGTDYTYERLRNMSLNTAETTPTENGAIAWAYE